MNTLGICLGASSISLVLLNTKNNTSSVIATKTLSHEGNPKQIIKDLSTEDIWKKADKIIVTGRKFKDIVNLTSISEIEAVEFAYDYIKAEAKGTNLIISAGGETFMAYKISDQGKIIDVYTGSKCASGTGEFFLQQLKRMNISIEEALAEADVNNSYKLAGRCSVFCKSDCTHALNKGVLKKNIIAGLCQMMANKISELIKKENTKNLLIIGGLSKNNIMIDFVKKKADKVLTSDYSSVFEALGAALWGINNEVKSIENNNLFNNNKISFSFHPNLSNYSSRVTFKEMTKVVPQNGDKCIVGLDVGSTTTKAVLIRQRDSGLIADCYLRTNGDPIEASRQCYKNINNQLDVDIEIIGLGITGSGRQISGLHALTPSIINEIIAHAKAASFFDDEVDTIFEIGGQDAKYTYLINGVASDYAMNEACSAGTGSFLEEAAKEALGIDTLEIEQVALKSTKAPNFNDQCSAFISNDIKLAIQEGIKIEDITAGLVYSICLNYANRVKGNRVVGKKIFMQGGVCYNKAIPIAMAALIDKDIIVPPNPGLMGAFGVALNVSEKISLGVQEELYFNLKELSKREVEYKDPFICAGGAEKCDRKCSINRILINKKVYPFGGACNKYYNLLQNKKDLNINKLDLVKLRERLVFETYSLNYGKVFSPKKNKSVGINNSLLVNTLFPLYYNFFNSLGFDVILTKEICSNSIEQKSSEFCYPIELSHGSMGALIKQNPDIYFLPHVKSIPVKKDDKPSVTCPFVQGESYYLKAAFKEMKNKKVLNPFLDFSDNYLNEKNKFINLSKDLGVSKSEAEKAFLYACKAQMDFHIETKRIGKKVLEDLEKKPNEIAIVLFGRPYNAFSKQANMGVPNKFASRAYQIIPYDFLTIENYNLDGNMYWAMGRLILKSAQIVKNHSQLFGTYITNFSCGPDSFLTGFFRSEMAEKPSLLLELDNHTADAGLDTRIEAFLDVVNSYLEIRKTKKEKIESSFQTAEIISKNKSMYFKSSEGKLYSLKDKKVHVLVPPSSNLGAELMAASMRYVGVNATTVTNIGEEELKMGRRASSCKECLPLTLVLGVLLKYIKDRKNEDELLVYFMPETSGPCRFGQYNVFIKNIIKNSELKNIAILSLTSENSYAGFGPKFTLRAWHFIIIEDVLQEIYSAILTLSVDKEEGLNIYNNICKKIVESLAVDAWKDLENTLKWAVKELNKIKLTKSLNETPKIGLVGEIYVRRNPFSSQFLIEKLAEKGIITKVSPGAEWIYYCDYIVKNKLVVKSNFKDIVKTIIKGFFKNKYEKIIKNIFNKSKLYDLHMVDVDTIINNVSDLISPKLTGEAILTIGASITEIVEDVEGVISIGPFGCMPSRISEAILNDKLNEKKKENIKDNDLVTKVMEHYPSLPFLAIETDGNPFSQIIESKLESFCLQVKRISELTLKERILHKKNKL